MSQGCGPFLAPKHIGRNALTTLRPNGACYEQGLIKAPRPKSPTMQGNWHQQRFWKGCGSGRHELRHEARKTQFASIFQPQRKVARHISIGYSCKHPIMLWRSRETRSADQAGQIHWRGAESAPCIGQMVQLLPA
jgi:hypothetical protein